MIEVVYAQSVEKVPLKSGQIANVVTGQHWPVTDPVVKARPDLFTEDTRYGLMFSEAPPGYDGELNQLDFEEATAAPGEKRSVRRRRTEDRDES